ncbi:MAG: hypothetical protein WBG91_16955, partial [Syntrophobacteria bacterium]
KLDCSTNPKTFFRRFSHVNELAKPFLSDSLQLAEIYGTSQLKYSVFPPFSVCVSFFNAMRFALCAMLRHWTKIN